MKKAAKGEPTSAKLDDVIQAGRSASTKPIKKKSKTPKFPPVRRGGAARLLSDFVPDIGETAFRKFGFIQSSILSRWSEIVGERLAQVAQPAMIRFPAGKKSGGTLHLSINSASAPMLQHVAPDIIASVNRYFGYAAITKIHMAHGLAVPPPPKPKGPLAPIPDDLKQSLANVEDPELRQVLERIATGIANASPLSNRQRK